MSDKKYLVPEGMLKAAHAAFDEGKRKPIEMLEAAIRWLAENAPKPEQRQCEEMWHASYDDGEYCREWVRRMFLAPEPKVPDAVKDLLWRPRAHGTRLDEQLEQYDAAHDADVLEAYNRGKAGK